MANATFGYRTRRWVPDDWFIDPEERCSGHRTPGVDVVCMSTTLRLSIRALFGCGMYVLDDAAGGLVADSSSSGLELGSDGMR